MLLIKAITLFFVTINLPASIFVLIISNGYTNTTFLHRESNPGTFVEAQCSVSIPLKNSEELVKYSSSWKPVIRYWNNRTNALYSKELATVSVSALLSITSGGTHWSANTLIITNVIQCAWLNDLLVTVRVVRVHHCRPSICHTL